MRVASPQGRFSTGAQVLDGRSLRAVDAWGKHLFYGFEGLPRTLHIHLGLFGRFRHVRRPSSAPANEPRMVMTGTAREVRLSGPTACDLLGPRVKKQLLARLGPDPLRSDADPEAFLARARRSRRAIGSLLLDQSTIAGVGNVYRSELCFLIGTHPGRPARDIPEATLVELWDRAVELLRVGAKLNRIVTVNAWEGDRACARELRRGERVYVYGRSRCFRCGGEVAMSVIGSRKAYACTHCQGRSP